MIKNEFLAVINELNTFYQKIETAPELERWWEQLKDLDGKQTLVAVKHLVNTDTSGFRPMPAKIRETISEMSGTKRMSASEAWLIARPKCNRYVTREELEKLPDEIRKCIREAGGTSYLGEQPEYRAQKAFESAWNAMGDTEKREQVQRIGSGQGLKQIGG